MPKSVRRPTLIVDGRVVRCREQKRHASDPDFKIAIFACPACLDRVYTAILFVVTAWVAALLIRATLAPVRIGSCGKYGDIYVQCERRRGW